MKYIALLRGINVGGNNTVPMVQLKTFFEQAGFVDVATYINSGNVLFTSEIADASLCKAICENLLATHFYFKIPVMVISAFDLCEAMRNAPAWWNADDRSSTTRFS